MSFTLCISFGEEGLSESGQFQELPVAILELFTPSLHEHPVGCNVPFLEETTFQQKLGWEWFQQHCLALYRF